MLSCWYWQFNGICIDTQTNWPKVSKWKDRCQWCMDDSILWVQRQRGIPPRVRDGVRNETEARMQTCWWSADVMMTEPRCWDKSEKSSQRKGRWMQWSECKQEMSRMSQEEKESNLRMFQVPLSGLTSENHTRKLLEMQHGAGIFSKKGGVYIQGIPVAMC